MSEPSDTTTPQAAPRKASRKRAILMMVLGGFVLAFGGCALFLGNLNMNSDNPVANIGGVAFIVGVLVFIAGVLWALARWIDRRFDRTKPK